MKLKGLFVLASLCCPTLALGQTYVATGDNLVPNPSFEETRACPKDADYIGGVVAWNLFPNFSSDYFHRCANRFQTREYQARFPLETILNFGVPRNLFGYQEPHSGDAYAGISFCNEALAVKLTQPLEKDSLYMVRFFASLADSSNVGTRYLGIELSESSIRVQNDNRMQISGFILEAPPQVMNPHDRYLTDTMNWTPISGFYRARGGEQYLTISGFYPFNDSLVTLLHPKRALARQYRVTEKQLGYYYIDDVSVIPYSERWEVELGKAYIMKHIYFDFDKSELLPASSFELDKLATLLKNNERYHVLITGHTDNMGSDAYNERLSLDRARAVANYLIDNNIDETRVSYRGAGSTLPIAENDSPEGRELNRRVEFMLSVE